MAAGLINLSLQKGHPFSHFLLPRLAFLSQAVHPSVLCLPQFLTMLRLCSGHLRLQERDFLGRFLLPAFALLGQALHTGLLSLVKLVLQQGIACALPFPLRFERYLSLSGLFFLGQTVYLGLVQALFQVVDTALQHAGFVLKRVSLLIQPFLQALVDALRLGKLYFRLGKGVELSSAARSAAAGGILVCVIESVGVHGLLAAQDARARGRHCLNLGIWADLGLFPRYAGEGEKR